MKISGWWEGTKFEIYRWKRVHNLSHLLHIYCIEERETTGQSDFSLPAGDKVAQLRPTISLNSVGPTQPS
jgi:hypothetical protein